MFVNKKNFLIKKEWKDRCVGKRKNKKVLRWCEEKRKEGRFDPLISTAGVNMAINIVSIDK